MDFVKVAVIGAGSVRCSVPVLASLATYFGERPLEIALYDADAERLELFEMFARLVFAQNKNPHEITASSDYMDVLAGASKVILQLDSNCALKEARGGKHRVPSDPAKRVASTLERLKPLIADDALVVSLLPPEVPVTLGYYYRLEWPSHLDADETRSLPHQVLRWIRGEEYLYEILREHERSPLKAWLDDPTTATIVSET